MDIFGGIVDWILDFIYGLLESVLSILPDSPIQNNEYIQGLNSTFENIMGYINYFVPVGTMLGITAAYLVAVSMWYVVRWVMRLARYID